MAIQPIDLQTMYAQISNIAQNAQHVQSGAKLAESLQGQNVIQQNKEKGERVQKTSGDSANTSAVRDEGKGNGTFAGSSHQENQKNENDAPVSQNKIFDPRLGQHIDISR